VKKLQAAESIFVDSPDVRGRSWLAPGRRESDTVSTDGRRWVCPPLLRGGTRLHVAKEAVRTDMQAPLKYASLPVETPTRRFDERAMSVSARGHRPCDLLRTALCGTVIPYGSTPPWPSDCG
jgi:hypothetical protein